MRLSFDLGCCLGLGVCCLKACRAQHSTSSRQNRLNENPAMIPVENIGRGGRNNSYGLRGERTVVPTAKFATARYSQRGMFWTYTKNMRNAGSMHRHLPFRQEKTNRAEASDVKVAELHLATSLCCHAAVSSVDHLCEAAKKNGTGSTIGKINPHPTKCSKLITEVSPAFQA